MNRCCPEQELVWRESVCTLAGMDSEKWDSSWSERGLVGLTDVLVSHWAPIWAGSDQPSIADLRSEAMKIGKRWRGGAALRRRPGLPPRRDTLADWLWERERDLEQRHPTPEHRRELIALASQIERWRIEEYDGPSRAFLPHAVASAFQWVVDEYGYERQPTARARRGDGTIDPPGWDGHVNHHYENEANRIGVWLSLGHGFGVRIRLCSRCTEWYSLAPLERCLERRGLPVPTIELPRGWCTGYDQRIIDAWSSVLHQLVP
jgi:hypothetical protein